MLMLFGNNLGASCANVGMIRVGTDVLGVLPAALALVSAGLFHGHRNSFKAALEGTLAFIFKLNGRNDKHVGKLILYTR